MKLTGHSRWAAIALMVGYFVAPADAATLLYTETSTISGSLNGVQFASASLTLTATADTAAIVFGGCCYFTSPIIYFDVAGVGAGRFTGQGRLATGAGNAGFGHIATNRAILYTSNPGAFADFDLTTPIDPVTGNAVYSPGFAFPTSAGSLVIWNTGSPTFSASPVPLPPPAGLLVAGFGLLAAMKRRAVPMAETKT